MRKPKCCVASSRPLIPRGRVEKFDEALEKLRTYGERAGDWDEMCDFLASEAVEKCARNFLFWWHAEQSTPPPYFVRFQLLRIVKAARAIASLNEENHWAARALVEEKLGGMPNTLSAALEQTQRILKALESAAAGDCRIKDSDFPSAKLHLLEGCRRIMEDASGVRPGLSKYNVINEGGPLLRFTRTVFEYATGLRTAPGSFDNEVEILRAVYPCKVPVRCAF